VRGGIDTGEATVGVFGDGEWSLFTVVGAPVVHAGWLAGYAVHGEVLATAAAVLHSGLAAELDDPSTISVHTADLQVYRLRVPREVAALPTEELPDDETISDTGRTRPGARANLGTAPERIEVGTELGGRFRVLSRLGRGGMGAVYEVEDRAVGESVALKLVDTGAADRERIRREVRLARLVTHENVCRVFDLHLFGEQPAVTMELIRGTSLGAHLREGRLELDRLLRWAIPMCNGLRAAHACGIVHRDLKPSNVLIEDSGRPVLVDFGIARPAAEESGKKFEGTLDYVSPEQLQSYRSNALSDIYSMGVVMFQMATGTLPFTGESALARAMARGTDDPADPTSIVPDLHPGLVALILRCLEREPTSRFSRIADVSNNLERIAFQVGCAWRERVPVDASVAR
jgi:serine/threonine-protein kinase